MAADFGLTIVQESRGRRQAVWFFISFAAALILVMVPLLKSGRTSQVLFAEILWLLLICGVPVARRLGRRRLDLFEPPVFWSVWALLIFGFGTVGLFAYRTLWRPFLQASSFVRAYPLVLLAAVALWGGYELSRKFWTERIIPNQKQARLERTSLLLIAAIWGVGLVALVIKSGAAPFGFGYGSVDADEWNAIAPWLQWVSTAATLRVVALIALSIEALSPRAPRVWKVALAAVVGIEVTWAIVCGMKGAILFSVALPVAICWWYMRGSVPVKAILCIVVVVLLLLVPSGREFRLYLIRERSQSDSVLHRLKTQKDLAAAYWSNATVSSYWKFVAKSYARRFGHIEIIATALEKTPSPNEYLHRRDFALLPALIFIPRFLWPGKPVLNYGRRFSYVYRGHPSETISATGPTWIGDLYIHFGILGVVSGMAAISFIWSGLYTWFRSRPSKLSLLVYAGSLYSLTAFEKDFITTVAGSVRTMIFCLLCGLLFYRLAGRSCRWSRS